MRYAGAVAVIMVVAACSGPRRGVRASDVRAWEGVSIDDLETHPLFSTLPSSRKQLSSGRVMWTFSNCKIIQYDSRCTTYVSPNSIVGQTATTNCSGGGSDKRCCYNQFITEGDRVIEYRPVGNCFTDCSVRPASARCATDDEVSKAP